VYFLEGDHEKSEDLFKKALKNKEEILGDSHPDVARVVNRLGTLYIEQSRYCDAEACFQKALAIRIAKLGPNHSRVGQTLKHLLTLYELQEKFDRAFDCGLKALQITEKILGVEHLQTSNILLRLGTLCWAMSNEDEGTKYLERCITIREKKLGSANTQVTDAKKILNELMHPAVVEPVHVASEIELDPNIPPPVDSVRNALLSDIQNFGKKKLRAKEEKAERKTRAAHTTWWQQNYSYGEKAKMMFKPMSGHSTKVSSKPQVLPPPNNARQAPQQQGHPQQAPQQQGYPQQKAAQPQQQPQQALSIPKGKPPPQQASGIPKPPPKAPPKGFNK